MLHARERLRAQGIPSAADATSSSVAPALVSHVMPVYPQIAQAARVAGLVRLDATVGLDGRVAAVSVARSIPLLDQAAIDAVRQWRFMPPSDKSAKVTVTVRFSIDDPSLYPRPATYGQPLPSLVPENFAFVYAYACRRTTVEIDSIARSVTTTVGPPTTAQRSVAGFGFEGEQAADVLVMLVGAGFFEASREGRMTWQEVAPVEPGLQQRGDQIVVEVSAQPPIAYLTNIAQIHWLGDDEPARYFSHVLRVRRGDRWTEFRWSEPLNGRRPEDEKTIAAAGKRIRALVTANLTGALMLPVCL